MNDLSVVLPVYNEEFNIKKTIMDAVDFLRSQDVIYDYEIIAVNDGSTDQTGIILKELMDVRCLKVVTNPKNLGYGGALVAGIKITQYSNILLMDSDGQFQLRSVENAFDKFPKFDIIAGYREYRADSLYRKTLGNVYTFIACSVFGLKLRDMNCGFKLFKKGTLNLDFEPCHAGVFYTEFFIKAKESSLKVYEMPVDHFPRSGGRQTGANGIVIIQAILDLFKLRLFKKK